MSEPRWVTIGRTFLGLREIPGAPTSPVIAGWLADLKAWWKDDETPWCGTACAAWMRAAGVELPQHWYRAKGWLDWGVRLSTPVLGCVVVFERDGGGHVGLVVGAFLGGDLLVLGGNQGDAVRLSRFQRARVAGYRWPPAVPLMVDALPVVTTANDAQPSRNEA